MELPGYSNYLIYPGDNNNKEGCVWSKQRKGTNNKTIGGKFLKPQLTQNSYL